MYGEYVYGDAGRANCALTAVRTRRSQGTVRNSRRETSSMASISVDNHSLSPFPDRQGWNRWAIACSLGLFLARPQTVVTNPDVTNPFPVTIQLKKLRQM
jgi:hypothetical protein